MMLFDQSNLAQPPQSLIHGIFFANAAFPRNRLSRRKRDACAAVAMLAEATVDRYITRL